MRSYEIVHLVDLVFPDHHDAESSHRLQRALHCVDQVVVEVDEDQARQVRQIRDLADEVILIVEEPQPGVSLNTTDRARSFLGFVDALAEKG